MATYMIRMVTATANTMTEPSFARMEGSRSKGRVPRGRAASSMLGPSSAGAMRPIPVFQERISDDVHRADVPGLARVVGKLPADPGDVGVDHSAPRVVAVAPHPLHELVPTEDHARVPD